MRERWCTSWLRCRSIYVAVTALGRYLGCAKPQAERRGHRHQAVGHSARSEAHVDVATTVGHRYYGSFPLRS